MISIFSLPNGQLLIGNIVEQDDVTIKVEYPLIMVLSNPIAQATSIYTARYMPMASEGLVSFNKNNIVGVASIDPPLQSYYDKMVDFYKSRKSLYRSVDDAEQAQKELDAIAQNDQENEVPNIDNVSEEELAAYFESKDKTKH